MKIITNLDDKLSTCILRFSKQKLPCIGYRFRFNTVPFFEFSLYNVPSLSN